MEKKHARLYSKANGVFEWKNYVIIAVPDGLTKKFCYEFKGTKDKFLATYMKHVGLNQANLYSYFFNRPKYKLDIYIEKQEQRETFLNKTDPQKAEKQIEKIDLLLKGKLAPTPPAKFKCKSCEFSSICKIKP